MKLPKFFSKKITALKSWLEREAEEMRIIVATSPKFILWRLELFRWSPFLSKHIFRILFGIVVFLSFFSSFYLFSWRSPRPFPDQALITVERGEPLSQITSSFEERGVVISSLWLRFFVTVLGGQNKVIAGDYYFPEAKNVFSVAWMLHRGQFGLIPIKVTIPEGTSSFDIANMLKDKLPAFDPKDFVDKVDKGNYEGYLFPDTYFFMPNAKADDVILTMRENFARQIEQYQSDIEKIGKPMDQIITMASIIEGEANGSLESKRIVSGILWKRLSLGMPLQVDAPFRYYNGKHSYTLTTDDLKEDHPYNTYVNKGLPPTAINNPGVDSIRAAIAPTNTDYLYFMSDKKGNMYYAKDFEGHQANREKYLR